MLDSTFVIERHRSVSLLTSLIEQAVKKLGFKKPKALVCIPSDATEKEFTDLVDLTLRAGVSSVAVIQESAQGLMEVRLRKYAD